LQTRKILLSARVGFNRTSGTLFVAGGDLSLENLSIRYANHGESHEENPVAAGCVVAAGYCLD